MKLKSYLEVVLFSILLASDLALIILAFVNSRFVVPLHVLDHVAFLGIGSTTDFALVGLHAFVHSDVVEDAPGPGELFVAAVVFAQVHSCDTSFGVLTFFDSNLVFLEALDVLKRLCMGGGSSANMAIRNVLSINW